MGAVCVAQVGGSSRSINLKDSLSAKSISVVWSNIPVTRNKLDLWARFVLLSTVAVVFRLTQMQRRRAGTDFARVDTYAAIEIALVVLTCLMLAFRPSLLLRVWKGLKQTSGRLLSLFFVIAMASAVWSVMPSYTFFRAGEFAVESLAILTVLACAGSFSRAERIAIFSAFCIVFMDAFGNILGGLNLALLHSNSLGASAVMLFCYGLGEALVHQGKDRQRFIAMAGLALSFVFVSRSLASWWCVLLGVSLAFFLSRSQRMFFLLGIIVLGLGIWFAGVQKLQPVIDPHGEIDKMQTLHGRELLWNDYWKTIRENPWTGVGYAVGPRVAGSVYTTNAHNSAIAVLLGTGLVGGIFLLLSLLLGFREALSACRARQPGAIGAVTALIAGSVNSMSISVFGDAWAPSSFVFMMFYSFFLFAVLRPQLAAQRFRLRWANLAVARLRPRQISWQHESGASKARTIAINS
jgi:O-antigen ligase